MERNNPFVCGTVTAVPPEKVNPILAAMSGYEGSSYVCMILVDSPSGKCEKHNMPLLFDDSPELIGKFN